MSSVSGKTSRLTIGWREWVQLPELCTPAMKVKVDTGAHTSALHAFGLRTVETDDGMVAMFEVHPHQRSSAGAKSVVYPVKSFRKIRSSNGKVEERPVIQTNAVIGGHRWPIEVTLTSRDQMGFRMLLGRAALRGRFLVNPGRSYLVSDPKYRSEPPS